MPMHRQGKSRQGNVIVNIGETMNIVVLGAGPTGLTVAVELARHGVFPDIVNFFVYDQLNQAAF